MKHCSECSRALEERNVTINKVEQFKIDLCDWCYEWLNGKKEDDI